MVRASSPNLSWRQAAVSLPQQAQALRFQTRGQASAVAVDGIGHAAVQIEELSCEFQLETSLWASMISAGSMETSQIPPTVTFSKRWLQVIIPIPQFWRASSSSPLPSRQTWFFPSRSLVWCKARGAAQDGCIQLDKPSHASGELESAMAASGRGPTGTEALRLLADVPHHRISSKWTPLPYLQ